MNNFGKKVKKLVDEFLILYRENPGSIVPAIEKKRMKLLFAKILDNKQFTSDEWSKIKPHIPEPGELIEQRKQEYKEEHVKSQILATQIENRKILEETMRLKNGNQLLEQKIRISVAKHTGVLPKGGSIVKICKDCKKRFTEGEFQKHIKTCEKKKA